MKQVVLGLGCDRGTSLQTLELAIAKALELVNLNMESVQQLATIDKKNDELGLLALATKYQLPLRFFSALELSQVKVPTPSAVVMKYMGTPSVAEAAALLAAQTNLTDLVLEKFKYRGDDGKNATVSVVMTNIEVKK